ncbi:hypothetical protein J2755_001557 [Methanohalophilus levihalophilus]|nr:hypothetical protein [Methanohalophilus levihalophilus]
MTRMTNSHQKNAISAMKDIFEMDKSRDPEATEVNSLLESLGTHGSLVGKTAVYNGSELSHVHTKKAVTKDKRL